MKIRPEILDHWPEVSARFPAGFDLEATARLRGAFTRAREIKSAEMLLRLALAYGGLGMSLRETCAWAEAGGIASLSDPSLLDRLCKAAPWLGDIVAALIAEQAKVPAGRWAGYRLRALDGTSICEPGADRTTWRLHVGYDLATGQVDQLELTDVHGAENLQRLTYRPGDIVLGDRCYARPRDLRPVIDAGADFIVRIGWNSLRLLQANGEPFDLFAALATQSEQESEAQVRVHEGITPALQPLMLRLVIRRKEPEQAEATRPAQPRGGEVHSAADLVASRRLPAARHPRHLPLSLANRAGVQKVQEPGRPRHAAGQEAGTRPRMDLCKADPRHHRRTDCRASPGLFPLWTRQRHQRQVHRAGVS
jgi:hypothetical protein